MECMSSVLTNQGNANTGCPTRYRTRHFFNNFTTNEDIATKLEADYRHIPLHFSHNERKGKVIPLQARCGPEGG